MFYWFGWIISFLFLRVFFRVKIKGNEFIPGDGPLIICSNHISYLDPPLVGTLLTRKRVYFMAKEELFRIFLFRIVLLNLGAFPVKRYKPDRKAIQRSIQLLKDGKILGIFPEGTCSKTGELQEPLDGASMIALMSKAPILPVAIKGPYKLFRPLWVAIGKPFLLDVNRGDKKSKDEIKNTSKRIMTEIQSLMQ